MAARIVIAVVILVAVGVVAWFLRRRPPERAAARRLPGAQAARPRRLPARRSRVAGRAVLVGRVRLVPGPRRQARRRSSRPTSRSCEIDAEHYGALHRRYELAAIPTTVIADHEGVVRRAFVGAFTATDLWAAVAELRDPGSTPEPDLGAV